MSMNRKTEEAIVQALQECSDQVIAPLSLKQNIDMEIDKRIMEEHHIMKRWNLKKCIILVAACCLVLSMGVFAAGQVTGYCTSKVPEKNYSSYADLPKAAKAAGFDFKSVENFSNGYQFVNMTVMTTDKTDDGFNTVGSFQEWYCEYADASGNSLSMYVHPTQPEEERRTPDAVTSIGTTEIGYYVDHYKFVPADYELTDEDKENEAKDNYYISYGSDEVEECDYINIGWEENGISYSIMGRDLTLSSDELFAMAGEVINQ